MSLGGWTLTAHITGGHTKGCTTWTFPVTVAGKVRQALDELDLSQAGFAEAIGVSPMRVSLVIKGARPVTAELALLFGRAFGQTPQYWLNLQADYDLKAVEKAMVKRLRHVTALVPA